MSRAAVVARALLAHPRLLAAILLAILGTSIALLPHLRIDSGVELFFRRDSNDHKILDEARELFVTDDVIFVLYGVDSVCSRESLELVRELGHRLEDLTLSTPDEADEPRYPVDEVMSLATVDTLIGSERSFRTVDLVPDPVPADPESLAEVERRIHANPVIEQTLLSKDGRVGVLEIRPVTTLNQDESAETVELIRATVAAIQEEHPGVEMHVLGESVVDFDMAHYQARDLGRFIPIVYALVILLLLVFVRRLLGVALTLLNVTVCLLAATGLLTAIGSTVNNTSVLLPPLMVALSVATTIHFLSEYGKNGRRVAHPDAAQKTIAELLAPVLMASLTTGIGFGSLAVSQIPAIHEFAIAAGGSMALMALITIFVVAVSFRRWAPEKLISERGVALASPFNASLGRLAELIIRRPKTALVGSLVLTVAMVAGIPRIVADENYLEFFPKGEPVRAANEYMETHVSGSTLFTVVVRTEEDGRFLEPRELRKVEMLQRFLVEDLGAEVVIGVTDFVKLMHREFAAGDPTAYRLPDTAEQVAQLLLLNGDDRVEEFIDEQHRSVRVVGRVRGHLSSTLGAVYGVLDRYLAEHFPVAEGYRADATGESRLWSTLFRDLLQSQVGSISLSVVLIFGLMFLLFWSATTGLCSIPPNAFPILITLGAMGWSGIRLDTATVMIATVALGIAVDDTVHFLQFYRRRLVLGVDPENALRETMAHKGPAIVATTVVISLGFLVVISATFIPTRMFGILTAIAMVAALVGDIVFLPALILSTKTRLGVTFSDGAEDASVAATLAVEEP